MDLPHLLLPIPFFSKEIRNAGFETVCMAGERYIGMLQNDIIPSLADKYLLKSTTFMQHGALRHFSRQVKELFCRSFSNNRVLSHYFRCAWPPRSPDVITCDYWLWGNIKSQINCDGLTSIGMLKENIRRQFLTILIHMLFTTLYFDYSYC